MSSQTAPKTGVSAPVSWTETAAPFRELPGLRVLPADLGVAVAERELLARPRTGSLALARRLPELRERFGAAPGTKDASG